MTFTVQVTLLPVGAVVGEFGANEMEKSGAAVEPCPLPLTGRAAAAGLNESDDWGETVLLVLGDLAPGIVVACAAPLTGGPDEEVAALAFPLVL